MRIRSLAGVLAMIAASMLALSATAQVVTTRAGPIWNNHDAQNKCPAVCARANMGWKGVWRTPQMSTESECDCVRGEGARGPERDHHGPDWGRNGPSWSHHGSGWGHGSAFAGGSGNSCRAPSVRQCRGCSVTCRSDQTAHCQEGSVGIFNGPNDTICSKEASCVCR